MNSNVLNHCVSTQRIRLFGRRSLYRDVLSPTGSLGTPCNLENRTQGWGDDGTQGWAQVFKAQKHVCYLPSHQKATEFSHFLERVLFMSTTHSKECSWLSIAQVTHTLSNQVKETAP